MLTLEYYQYLLYLSWPALCGLFSIYFFLGVRFFQASKKKKGNIPGFIRLTARLLITILALTVYTKIFLANYQDWTRRPSTYVGVVESLQAGPGRNEYCLTIISGEEEIPVLVDKNIFAFLRKNDRIEISFLPIKKEGFKCTLITR